MCDARQEMHGDPEAMRRFAVRASGLSTRDLRVEAPGPPSCGGATEACATFAAADLASTSTLARFLDDTGEAIESLQAAAAAAADDYVATDQAGARAVAGAVVGIVVVEDR